MTESPALISVVYTSVAAEPFSDEALAELLVASRASNHEKSVTGMLLHREGRFIQFLEGPEATVRTLIATIAGDRRHGRVRVLLEDGIDARQFPEWTMGFASVDDAQMPEGFRSSSTTSRTATTVSSWRRRRATSPPGTAPVPSAGTRWVLRELGAARRATGRVRRVDERCDAISADQLVVP